MATSETFITHSPQETIALGRQFAARLHGGDVVALEGDLGSGKTHFTKGICLGLGYDGLVTSPTFALINEYDCTPAVYHIDLYRLDSAAQLVPLGLEELMRGDMIVIVEWPAIAKNILPAATYHIRCEQGTEEDERTFSVINNPVE